MALDPYPCCSGKGRGGGHLGLVLQEGEAEGIRATLLYAIREVCFLPLGRLGNLLLLQVSFCTA